MNTNESSDPQGYVLITGASSGIGRELAIVFARNGHNLVLVSRDEAKLNTVSGELTAEYGISAQVISADLAITQEIDRVYSLVSENGWEIAILVNNAGIGTYGPFREISFDEELQMINLNVIGLTHLTRLFVPDMVKRGRGKVLNVASMAGFMPVPYMAVYAATKAYVISFSHALSSELKGTGVTVSVLCPGRVPTGFQRTAGLEDTRTSEHTDAAAVARTAYRQLMRDRREIIPRFSMRLIKASSPFIPRHILSDMRAKHFKPK